MNKELLALYGARQAVLQIMDKGSCAFAKKLDGGTWQTIDWVDICNYLTELIESQKVRIK